MNIALIGTTGFMGSHIFTELLERKHTVTAISRNEPEVTHANVRVVAVDIHDTTKLVDALKGHDAVVSAYSPGATIPNAPEEFLKDPKAIQRAVEASGVNRFIVIEGAASLEAQPGVRIVDTWDDSQEYKPFILSEGKHNAAGLGIHKPTDRAVSGS